VPSHPLVLDGLLMTGSVPPHHGDSTDEGTDGTMEAEEEPLWSGTRRREKVIIAFTHKPVVDAVTRIIKTAVFNGQDHCPSPWPEGDVSYLNDLILSKWTAARRTLGRTDDWASSKVEERPRRKEARAVRKGGSLSLRTVSTDLC